MPGPPSRFWRRYQDWWPSPHGTNDPILVRLFSEMARQRKSYREIAKVSGVDKATLATWRGGQVEPKLGNVVAALGALGLELVVREKGI